MHASISGTIDFKERDDEACLRRVRELVSKYLPTERDYATALAVSRLVMYAFPHRVEELKQFFKQAARKFAASKGAPRDVARRLRHR